jgi:hypothetical protein
MRSTTDDPNSGAERSAAELVDDLLLDRIDALKVLRANTAEEKGALLEQIAGPGKPEQDIISQLSKPRPLYRPDRFMEAHRLAMRSLEVLDRNGNRSAAFSRKLGPLEPVADYVVGLMTRYIVKGYQNSTIENVRKLYERREANAQWGTPEHSMLRQARIDASRVEPGYKGNPLGLPTFLLGGAVISSIVSGLTALVDIVFHNVLAFIVTTIVLGLLFLALAWCALFSASVARRRIRLSTQQPLKALWETIGACGNPPKDESYNFAVYAIVLLVAASLLVPAALAILFGGVLG